MTAAIPKALRWPLQDAAEQYDTAWLGLPREVQEELADLVATSLDRRDDANRPLRGAAALADEDNAGETRWYYELALRAERASTNPGWHPEGVQEDEYFDRLERAADMREAMRVVLPLRFEREEWGAW